MFYWFPSNSKLGLTRMPDMPYVHRNKNLLLLRPLKSERNMPTIKVEEAWFPGIEACATLTQVLEAIFQVVFGLANLSAEMRCSDLSSQFFGDLLLHFSMTIMDQVQRTNSTKRSDGSKERDLQERFSRPNKRP